MENIIIIVCLIILVGMASLYLWNEKRKGRKCIGCPCSGTASCHCNSKSK